MSEKKDTIRRLSEQSQSVVKKTLDRLEDTRREVVERIKRARERGGLQPRHPTHPELPAVGR